MPYVFLGLVEEHVTFSKSEYQFQNVTIETPVQLDPKVLLVNQEQMGTMKKKSKKLILFLCVVHLFQCSR